MASRDSQRIEKGRILIRLNILDFKFGVVGIFYRWKILFINNNFPSSEHEVDRIENLVLVMVVF